RYFGEVKFVQPRGPPPSGRDYTQPESQRRFERAQAAEFRRRKRVRQLLRERLTEEPGVLVAGMLWLIRRLRLTRVDEQPLGPVAVADFPQLDDSRTKIKRYFEALERRSLAKAEDAGRFLTEARFESGYIPRIF